MKLGIKGGIISRGGSSGGLTPNGVPTLLSQSSVYLPGGSGAASYYTIPTGAGLIYPAADWADIFCVKLNVLGTLTQHLYNNGGFGGNGLVSAYIAAGVLNARITDNSGNLQTITDPGTTFANSLGNNAGWYYVCVRRVSGNLELSVAAMNGAAATKKSTAQTVSANAITPGGGTMYIGTRSDASSGNQLQKANIAYYARVNGTFTDANLTSLAAGQDIVNDLGFSPLAYIKFNTNAATIADSSGNGHTATLQGASALRGAPSFSGQPVTIDKSFDNWWGRVFQRDTHGVSTNITMTGTYAGNPTSILVRVIDKAGTQLSAPVAATSSLAGKWTATLTVPQGAEYTLEAYWSNDSTKIARSQMPWGVGMIVLLSGESTTDQQAAGSFTEGGFAPTFEQLSIIDQPDSWTVSTVYSTGNVRQDPDLYTIWKLNVAGNGQTSGAGSFAADRLANPTYWTQLDPYTQVTDFLTAPVGYVMHTIERLRANLGIPVMAAIGAKTGSQLVNTPNNWNTYSDPVTHGKVKGILSTIGGDAEAMIWNQGANDANASSPPAAATYQADLQALIPQLRTYFTNRTAANLPVFVGIVGRNSSNNSASDAGWRAVRNGIMAAIPLVTNCFEAGGLWDLTHSDALHPDGTTTGYYRMCKRQAQAILNYYQSLAFTNSMLAATVASAAVQGTNNIDVTFTLNNGTTLQGLTGATSLTGFLVKNGSAVTQTITSTSIPSATVARLTFAGTPIAGWTVDYIPTEAPDITNLLYTNASVVGDTAGIPVHPFTGPITL